MTDTTSAAPSDAEIEAFRDAFDWDGWTCPKAAQRAFARAVLAKWGAPQPVANQAPAPSFDDPRVQVVYSTICDNADWPPNGAPQQHWEGWIARRIVERLDACKPVARVPLTDGQVDDLIAAKHFHAGYELTASDKVCINWYRLGLRDGEHAHGIGTEKGDSHGLPT